jgi:hypothetical protein
LTLGSARSAGARLTKTVSSRFVGRFGEKAWMKVACQMGNRSDVQCRYHYIQMHRGATAPAPEPVPSHVAFNPLVQQQPKVQMQLPVQPKRVQDDKEEEMPLNRTPFDLKKSDPFFDSNPWLLRME